MVYAPWWNSAVTGGEDMVNSDQYGEGARDSILVYTRVGGDTASAKDRDEDNKVLNYIILSFY